MNKTNLNTDKITPGPVESKPTEKELVPQWLIVQSLLEDVKGMSSIFLNVFLSSLGFFLGMGYSEAEEQIMTVNTLFGETMIERLPDLPEIPIPKTFALKAVGDIVPGTNFPANHLHPQPERLFEPIKPLLKDEDLVFGNLETTLTNVPSSTKKVGNGRVFAFRSPPYYAQKLKEAGFDILNVANNHSRDFGEKGFTDTIANIEKAGMKAMGEKEKILYTEENGLKIAWIGFSYLPQHNSILAPKSAASLIQAAEKKADITIVSLHAGKEGDSALHTQNQTEFFYGENRGNVVDFSRRAIENGADLVLGHGPHVPRALELYQGKLIAYSLGNFVGYRTLSSSGVKGYSLVLEVKLAEDGEFLEGKIYSVLLKNGSIPHPSKKGETIALMKKLTQKDFPNTPLEITSQGEIRKLAKP